MSAINEIICTLDLTCFNYNRWHSLPWVIDKYLESHSQQAAADHLKGIKAPKNTHTFMGSSDKWDANRNVFGDAAVTILGRMSEIVSFGEALYRSLAAVERLKQEGIDIGLINKPIPFLIWAIKIKSDRDIRTGIKP